MINLEDYNREELTINPGKAQLLGAFYALPFMIILGGLYYYLWNTAIPESLYQYFAESLGKYNLFIVLGLILSGIIVHELIHGITWAKYATKGLQSMKFGVVWKYVTPYCHCEEPLLVKHYIIGALMPAIILGFTPGIIGVYTGNFGLIIFGLFFTFAAGGDFMIVNLLRKESMNNLVQDHPSIIGCYLYKPKHV